MCIRKKLISASVLFFILFLSMGIVNRAGNRVITGKIAISNMLEKETMHLQGIFRGINEFIIDEGEPLSIELTRKHLSGFREIHNALMNGSSNNELKQTLTLKIDPEWQVVKDGVNSFLEIEYISIDDDKAMLQYGKLIADAGTLLTQVESMSASAQKSAASMAKTIQNIINMAAAIILAVMSLLLYTLYRSINSINTAAGTLGSNSQKLTESAARIAGNTIEQSEQTSRAASAMEELSSSFAEVAQNTSNAAGSANDAAELAVKGGEVVSGTIESMNRISQSTKEAVDNIKALGRRSEQIGDIIGTISNISKQTNLLALNAAIEAARAGEQGKGFAVVADEVRKLAEKSSSASAKIGEMVKGIQNDTQSVVESIHASTKKIEEGVESSNQAGESLQNIVEVVQSVNDMIGKIAAAAGQQSKSGQEIAANLESVSSLTRQTSGQSRASSDATWNMNVLIRQIQHLISGISPDEENVQMERIS